MYAGVGWIIWRDESQLPKHLIFELHYLGGTEESYTLNFSRPGAQIIAQYYNLIHLGFTGYRDIMENTLRNARLLSRALETTGWYRCVSDIHRKKGDLTFEKGKPQYEEGDNSGDYNAGLPVVAFTFSDDVKKEYPNIQQVVISNLLRAKQYIIPNYPLPPNEEKTEILRVVVRETLSLDMIDRLVSDIIGVTESVLKSTGSELAAYQPVTSSIEVSPCLGCMDEAHVLTRGALERTLLTRAAGQASAQSSSPNACRRASQRVLSKAVLEVSQVGGRWNLDSYMRA